MGVYISLLEAWDAVFASCSMHVRDWDHMAAAIKRLVSSAKDKKDKEKRKENYRSIAVERQSGSENAASHGMVTE